MGHIYNGKAEFPLEVFDLEAHLLAELRVEVGERLVEQHDRRVDGDRPCEGNPLFLAAGKLVRIGPFAAAEARVGDCPARPFLDLGLPHLPDLERKGDVVEDVQVRPDGEGLEDHPEVPLLGWQVVFLEAGGKDLPTDGDFPLVKVLETGDHPQGCRLAAA